MKINTGHQYKDDIFNKLDFFFTKGKKILDVGCGDGSDAAIFMNEYKLKTSGIDIFEHENIKNIKGLIFQKSNILQIPYANGSFDYVFSHDVLHHIDEKNQNFTVHVEALKELKRICRRNGYIIIIEANRYNPLFYPHMVLMNKHNHFKQKYFKELINSIFTTVQFKNFEAHFYPRTLLKIFKIYELIIEKVTIFRSFLAYNVAIIQNDK